MHTYIAFLFRQRWFVLGAGLLLCLVGIEKPRVPDVAKRIDHPADGTVSERLRVG